MRWPILDILHSKYTPAFIKCNTPRAFNRICMVNIKSIIIFGCSVYQHCTYLKSMDIPPKFCLDVFLKGDNFNIIVDNICLPGTYCNVLRIGTPKNVPNGKLIILWCPKIRAKYNLTIISLKIGTSKNH